MKVRIMTILLLMLLAVLPGCSAEKETSIPQNEASGAVTLPNGAQSDAEYSPESPGTDDNVSFGTGSDNTQGERRAVWLSYLELQDLLSADKAQTQKHLENVFDNIDAMGLNTVIVQVRPFADAIYKSSYFPWSHIITGTQGQDPGYDPLQLMIDLARERDLRIEAWINPYRVKTPTQTLDTDTIIYQWLMEQDDYVVTTQGESGEAALSQALYLNPAIDENQALIVNGVKELVQNYDIDAIHFDDYFYPTTDVVFDSKAYEKSGKELSLDDWRRNNVNTLIHKVYEAIKAIDENMEFGISPQGNIDINYNKQYADVKYWIEKEGYLDYIMPQVYYGFKNSVPFAATVEEWADLASQSDVDLYIGLAAYKIGQEDQWAGEEGMDEWIVDGGDLLKRQVEFCRDLQGDSYKGFSLYNYGTLFQPEQSVKELVEEEKENLKTILK